MQDIPSLIQRQITVQGSRVTLVATVMTEDKVTVANSSKITAEVDLKIAKFLVESLLGYK